MGGISSVLGPYAENASSSSKYVGETSLPSISLSRLFLPQTMRVERVAAIPECMVVTYPVTDLS